MITDLNTSVTDISSEQLDALFENIPDSTLSADNLKIGKEEVIKVGQQNELPQIDLDQLEKDAETKVEEEKKEEVKGDDKKVEEKKEEVKPDDKKVEEKTEVKKEDEIKIDPSLLKSSVDYLIKKGVFKDFEGREDLEMTEEIYAQILEAQVSEIVSERFDQKKSSTGAYGQAIIDFVEQGGDPDLIIDLFKERKEVTEFDITSDDSKKELVSKYYKDVHGWKPEKIKRHLDFLATQEDALKDEASEIKNKYEEHFEKQASTLKQQQDVYNQEQVRRQKVFETSVKDAIKGYNVDDSTKQLLETSLFKFKELEDGTKVNNFYLKFAEWQADPKRYVELVEFITNHETYLKRKEIEAQNKAVDKTFKFVKGNAAVSKTTGTKHEELAETEAKAKGTDFRVMFKK